MFSWSVSIGPRTILTSSVSGVRIFRKLSSVERGGPGDWFLLLRLKRCPMYIVFPLGPVTLIEDFFLVVVVFVVGQYLNIVVFLGGL